MSMAYMYWTMTTEKKGEHKGCGLTAYLSGDAFRFQHPKI